MDSALTPDAIELSLRNCHHRHLVLTTVKSPAYIAITADANHSSKPAFLKVHLVTSLGTLSKAFPRSMNA